MERFSRAFNELGWPEWIQIGNARLRESLQVIESAFVRIRNKLIEDKFNFISLH
jgi:hypothetical protein